MSKENQRSQARRKAAGEGYLPDIHRSLPQSIDAEKGVLCSCLLSPQNVLDECVNLPPAAFYHPAHKIIFEEMLAMHAALMPVDFITLTERLKYKGLPDDATADQKKEYLGVLDRAGGAAAISELFTFVPTASNADYYIDIVREKFLLRQLIQTCTEFAGRGYVEQGEVKVLLDEFEQRVMALGVDGGNADDALRQAKVFVAEAVDSLEAVYRQRGKPVGLETGFHDLDRMTGGLKKKGLYIIAGRPSMGKTVLGVQIAVHNAMQQVPVALFSLEMSGAELAERMLGTNAEVNLQSWRTGFLGKTDIPRIMRAAEDLSKSGLFIDETCSLTIMELRARARRAVNRFGVRLIVVDYLQLLRAPSKRADFSRQAEVADISTGCKAMAKELDVPVIVLAQLNRDADNRRPQLSNLRESGSIEQDADVVGLIHRPWKDRDKTDDQLAEFKKDGEPAELIIAKQRNGPIGDINLKFLAHFTKFNGVTSALYSNNPEKRQHT